MRRDLEGAAIRGLFRACTVLLPCLLAACWLTSSFDGLVANSGGDGAVDARATDARAGDGKVDGLKMDSTVRAVEAGVDAHRADARIRDAKTGSDAADAARDTGADAGSLYRAAVLADGPLAYWRLGESMGTLAYDEMSPTTATYDPVFMLGQKGALVGDPNTAVLLDGDAGCVNASASAALSFSGTSAFSIEAWIKAVTIDDQYRHVFTQEVENSGNKDGFGLFVHRPSPGDTAELTFQRHADGTQTAITVDAPSLGAFAHVVGTYDGSQLELYVNGTQAGPPVSTTGTPAMGSVVGGAQVGCGAEPLGFDGTLDEIAVYGKALSAVRVAAHFDVGIEKE